MVIPALLLETTELNPKTTPSFPATLLNIKFNFLSIVYKSKSLQLKCLFSFISQNNLFD